MAPVGPGGIGKTRLALEVAEQIASHQWPSAAGNVFFVPLQSVTSSEYMLSALERVMNFGQEVG
jgi:hypothetical protein